MDGNQVRVMEVSETFEKFHCFDRLRFKEDFHLTDVRTVSSVLSLFLLCRIHFQKIGNVQLFKGLG